MKRTKIVCTLGPASWSEEVLRDLIAAGMDVARFNFSHGDHETHGRTLDRLRRLADEAGKPVAALADLQGPKIRVGRFANGPIELVSGDKFTITVDDIQGTKERVSTTYKELPKDVEVGETLLLADGLLEMKAIEVTETDVVCEVIHGGPLSNNKGINLPETRVSAPSLTEKDKRDLEFAIKREFDLVALSFVRRPQDIMDAQKIIHMARTRIPVIAKIERAEAVEQLEDIIDTAGGIMIARGDLGVELPPENVPIIQKRILERCNTLGVPVITATQMLESMIENPRPTRAEASDVANAIFDGTDAVMLSGETATGKFPVNAVKMMARIAEKAEASRFDNIPDRYELDPFASVEDAVANSSVLAADMLEASLMAVYTVSGATATRVAKYRPKVPIYAMTCSQKAARRLAVRWGVIPLIVPIVEDFDSLFVKVEEVFGEMGLVKNGDIVVVTAGVPLARPGTTNCIKVHRVEHGEAAMKGVSEHNGVKVKLCKCINCGLCVRMCPEGIFEMEGDKISVSPDKASMCIKDGLCVEACPAAAIEIEGSQLAYNKKQTPDR